VRRVGLASLRVARCLRRPECENKQFTCAVYSPGDGCTFREQRQTSMSCAAMFLAAQQDTARSLGVLIFGDNRRYSLLSVWERWVLKCLSYSLDSWFGVKVKPVLTGGGDLRVAQIDVPLSLAIPAFDRIAGLYNRHLNWREYANANDL